MGQEGRACQCCIFGTVDKWTGCCSASPSSRTCAKRLAHGSLQEWEEKQKAQREKILAGWKPEDEEDKEESGEDGAG